MRDDLYLGHGAWVRVFLRPWSWPYGWHDYGLYAFGAGPIGVMFWPPCPAPLRRPPKPGGRDGE